jgi:hypothetical protein
MERVARPHHWIGQYSGKHLVLVNQSMETAIQAMGAALP